MDPGLRRGDIVGEEGWGEVDWLTAAAWGRTKPAIGGPEARALALFWKANHVGANATAGPDNIDEFDKEN